jgi:hypothetical protein
MVSLLLVDAPTVAGFLLQPISAKQRVSDKAAAKKIGRTVDRDVDEDLEVVAIDDMSFSTEISPHTNAAQMI